MLQYLSPGVPDPSRARATYTFDRSTVVSAVTVVQHVNGIDQLEGFAGDSEATLVSVGVATGAAAEMSRPVFTFPSPRAGKMFRMVVRHTPLAVGWALYKLLPTMRQATAADIEAAAVAAAAAAAVPRVIAVSRGLGDGACCINPATNTAAGNPVDITTGAGLLLNPVPLSAYGAGGEANFGMHDHVVRL